MKIINRILLDKKIKYNYVFASQPYLYQASVHKHNDKDFKNSFISFYPNLFIGFEQMTSGDVV